MSAHRREIVLALREIDRILVRPEWVTDKGSCWIRRGDYDALIRALDVIGRACRAIPVLRLADRGAQP